MGVHHFLYSVFPIGVQPDLTEQVKFFEEYDFEFLPSGFSYLVRDGELIDKESNIVINSTEQLTQLPDKIIYGMIQYWEGKNDLGFTVGYVQNEERMIGVFNFLSSEIELIHAYLHARGANLASFMCEYYSRMGAEVIFGGSSEGLPYSRLLLCVNSQVKSIPKEAGFFLANEDSKYILSAQRELETTAIDQKKIYMCWPFSS